MRYSKIKFSLFQCHQFIVLFISLIILTEPVLSAEQFIYTTQEPPTNYLEEGKLVGTTVDIVNRMIQDLGLKTKIKCYPWLRALQIGIDQPNTILFTCGRSKKRVDLGFHFIGPVISRKHALFKLRSNPLTIRSISDIKNQNLVVGGREGDWRVDHLVQQGVQVDAVLYYHLNFKKLTYQHVDLIISSDLELPTILSQPKINIPLKEFEMAFVFREAPSYIMLSPNTPTSTIQQWEDTFKSFQQTDFFDTLAKKWSEKLGCTMVYTSDKGLNIVLE